jgi:hypothetical protein
MATSSNTTDSIINRFTYQNLPRIVSIPTYHSITQFAVVLDNRKKVLFVEVLKAMLRAALLWYKTFRKDLKDIGFIFNLYDPCMSNKKVQGLHQTILFHVDDLKLSHKMKLVYNKFEKWLNSKYSKHGKVTATHGKVHDHLGLELDCCKQGELKINMTKYAEQLPSATWDLGQGTLQRRQQETTYST